MVPVPAVAQPPGIVEVGEKLHDPGIGAGLFGQAPAVIIDPALVGLAVEAVQRQGKGVTDKLQQSLR